MAFTYPTDQLRLQQLYGLSRDELTSGSLLRSLMTEAEQFDTDNGTTIVTQIQSILTSLDDVTTGLLALEVAQSRGIRSLSIKGEYDVTYGAGGQSFAASAKVVVAKNNLLRLLDPRGRLAEAMLFKPLPEDRYPTSDNLYERWEVWSDV
jgi:hypothetical protein